jgi:hypothetical protein
MIVLRSICQERLLSGICLEGILRFPSEYVQQDEIVASSQATYINSKGLFRLFFSLREQTEMATEKN